MTGTNKPKRPTWEVREARRSVWRSAMIMYEAKSATSVATALRALLNRCEELKDAQEIEKRGSHGI